MSVTSRGESTLGPDHTGLIVFDALNVFMKPKNRPDKKKFLKENNIIGSMKAVLEGARKAGLTSFYPAAGYEADGSDVVLDRLTDSDMDLRPWNLDKPRPVIPRSDHDQQVISELKPAKGDVYLPKHRWSAFYATDLEFQLKMRNIDTVIIIGGSTDVGVASTAFAARDMDLGLVVVRGACFSTRGENNDFFMDRVFPRMGRVLSVEDTVALMLAGAKKIEMNSRK